MQKKKKRKACRQEPPAPMLSPFCPTYTFSFSLSLPQLSLPPCLDGADKKLHGSWRYPCAESRGQPTLLSPNSKFLNCPSLPARTSQDIAGRQSEPDRMTEGELSILQNQGLRCCSQFSLFSCLCHNLFLPHLLFSVYCTQALVPVLLFRTQDTRLPRNC